MKLYGLDLSSLDKLRLRGNSMIYMRSHTVIVLSIYVVQIQVQLHPQFSRHPKYIHNHSKVFYMMAVSMTRTVYDFIKIRKYLFTKEQAMW